MSNAYLNLQTLVIVDYNDGENILITNKYATKEEINSIPNILYVDVNEVKINYNGQLIEEEHLFVFLKKYQESIALKIDDRGHLILFIQEEENNYSIDQNEGHLLYTKQ